MRSVPAALAWELLQRAKWSLLGAFLAGTALPYLLIAAMQRELQLAPHDHSTVMIHVTMMLLNAVAFGGAILSAIGRPSRLSTFPVTSATMATWSLAPAMALMALEYVATATAFNVLLGLNWPLWGPAMFLAVNLAAVAAIMWLAEKSPWNFLFLVFPSMAALGVWLYSRYGLISYFGPPRMWHNVTLPEVATMLAMAALAFYVAVVGIARGRCGEYLRPPRFSVWLDKLLDPSPSTGGAFATPAKAQFWFEWRQKGWAMPAIVAIVLLPGFCLWLIFNRNPQALFEGVLGGGAFLTLGGLVLGVFVGNAGRSDGNMEMGHFLATRPMATADMSRAMLKTAGMSALAAWLLWAVALLAIYLVLLAANVSPRPRMPQELGWWYFPATLLGAWAGVSLTATMGQTGRAKLFVFTIVALVALYIALAALADYWAPHDPRFEERVFYLLLSAAGAVFVLGMGWSMSIARRRSLLHGPTALVGIGLWASASAWILLQCIQKQSAPLPAYAFLIGLLALAVFPLAGAPLALAWNRTR